MGLNKKGDGIVKKISFMYVTDIHATAKGYSGRKDDVPKSILKLLKEMKSIYKERKLDFILNGGDFFHTPDVSNKYCGELASILKGVKMYVVPGNHDLYGYNVETIDNSKLGLLAKSDVLKILDRKHPFTVKVGDKIINIEGQEYYAGIDTNVANDYRIDNKSDFNILVAHAMLLKEPFMPDVIKQTLIDDVETEADMVLAAHYHPGWKETIKGNTIFFNPGSSVRVENTKDNKTRMPRCIIFTINENLEVEYEYVEFKCAKPSEEIFKEEKERNADNIYSNAVDNIKDEIDNAKINSLDPLVALEAYRDNDEKSSKLVDLIKNDLQQIEEIETIDKGYVASNEEVYITGVHLKNFECHKDKKVDFVNGLNVILGETNSGKTAILRGIYWVLYDKPGGTGNIRTGARFCSVEVSFSNGYKVTRRRTNSSAGTYTIESPDGSKEEYKGFNNNIPVEVLNVMQMPEVFISGNKYRFNIASQLEGPFLISNTPSERIALIGSLVNAERLDKAISIYKNKRNIVKRDIGNVEEQIEKIDNEIKVLGDIGALKRNVEVISKAKEIVDLQMKQHSNYETLKTNYVNTVSSIVICNDKYLSINTIDKESIDEINIAIEENNKMIVLYEEYKETQHKLKELNEKINRITYNKDIDAMLSNIESIYLNIESLELNTTLLNNYKAVSTNINNINNKLSSNKYSSQIDALGDKMEKTINAIDKLNNSFDKYKNELLNNNSIKDRLKNVAIVNKTDELLLSSLIEKNESIIQLNSLFIKENEEIKKYNSKVNLINKKIDDLTNEHKVLIDEFNKETHICESCGQEINTEILINSI